MAVNLPYYLASKKFCKKVGDLFGGTKKSSYLCNRKNNKGGSLAQLNRASDYGSEGCGFESRGSHEQEEQTKKACFREFVPLCLYGRLVPAFMILCPWQGEIVVILFRVSG